MLKSNAASSHFRNSTHIRKDWSFHLTPSHPPAPPPLGHSSSLGTHRPPSLPLCPCSHHHGVGVLTVLPVLSSPRPLPVAILGRLPLAVSKIVSGSCWGFLAALVPPTTPGQLLFGSAGGSGGSSRCWLALYSSERQEEPRPTGADGSPVWGRTCCVQDGTLAALLLRRTEVHAVPVVLMLRTVTSDSWYLCSFCQKSSIVVQQHINTHTHTSTHAILLPPILLVLNKYTFSSSLKKIKTEQLRKVKLHSDQPYHNDHWQV